MWNKAKHLLRYMTGLQTGQSVVQRACTLLRTLDVQTGFDLICEMVAEGDFKYFSKWVNVRNEETGELEKRHRHFIHCGFRPNGERLVTDPRALLARRDAVGEGLSSILKTSLDHDATTRYRFNPEGMKIAKARNLGKKGDDFARLMQEEKRLRKSGIEGFYQPTYLEPRRPRSHVDGKGVMFSGGDGPRGMIEYADGVIPDPDNAEHALHCIGEEYGYTVDSARKVYESGSVFDDPSISKPCCSWAAAQAVVQIAAGEPCHYILQQDASQSGFQGSALAYGCENLFYLTNLMAGSPKQDLYSAVNDLVEVPEEHEAYAEDLRSRKMGKFMVMRIGYGAATKALVRGLMLHRPKKCSLELEDYYGNLSSSASRAFELNERVLNQDYKGIWRQMGWDLAFSAANGLARSYQDSIFGLSPRLREGVQNLRKAATNALEAGNYLTFRAMCGWEYCLFDPQPIKGEPGKRYRNKATGIDMYIRDMYNAASASMIAPDLMHAAWDASVRHIANVMCAKEGIPSSDIHDSAGTNVASGLRKKMHWNHSYWVVGCTLPELYRGILADHGVVDNNKCGGKDLDTSDLLGSQHFMS